MEGKKSVMSNLALRLSEVLINDSIYEKNQKRLENADQKGFPELFVIQIQKSGTKKTNHSL